MDFLINSWYDLSDDEKSYFQNKSKKQLQDRWKTQEGIEIRRKILEMNFTRGKSKNYAPFVGFCTSRDFKNELLLDLRGFDLSSYSNLFAEKIVKLDFSNCNLEYSDFSNSEIALCDFSYSQIKNSNFKNTLLDECSFKKSNLSFCDFSNTQLEKANIKNANISEINLEKSNIEDLIFNKKTNFRKIDIKNIEELNNDNFYSFIKKKALLKLKSKKSFLYILIYKLLY